MIVLTHFYKYLFDNKFVFYPFLIMVNTTLKESLQIAHD
ncbi:hypothetical protein BCG9842_0212 (plasmid) [Bacillus cereus G9842]|uniref:Uncharacterized protein n=1 Tax=Bacillus cereus (strain G9842) TaxID=405531 RepID=B7IZ02_BACC2|nr:hypothetical protein BCG9842_0212 [Bacillus cereus G9842]